MESGAHGFSVYLNLITSMTYKMYNYIFCMCINFACTSYIDVVNWIAWGHKYKCNDVTVVR